MTAHELARKLLEGPDVVVTYVNQTYDETTVCNVDTATPVTLWSIRLVGEHWSDWSEDEPAAGDERDRRSIQALRLR